MKTLLLMAASGLALLFAGSAFAGEATTENTQDQATEQQTTGTAVTSTVAETESFMHGTPRYGSYQDNSDNYSGEIAGGYSAEELIGKSLVGPDGESVGEVHDLLIGDNNKIDQVLVDVGAFLGMGERLVALNIEELQVSADGNFVTNKTQEELEQMPEFDKAEAEWTVRSVN